MLGVDELATQTIVFMVAATLAMIPLGIQEATCSITGNCIGANNVPLAKRFFALITKIALVVILVISLTYGLCRYQITNFYVSDEIVV